MFIVDLFRTILWQPLFNLLIIFYRYIPGNDFGLAIIILTILVRLILWPLQQKATRSQLALQTLQPKLKDIQEKYKNDKEKLSKEFLGLYRKEKINPFSGILLLILQFPILIALYRVFWKGLNEESFVYLYSSIARPEIIDPSFLGMVNLNEPNFIFAILVGLVQFIQIKTATIAAENDGKKRKGLGSAARRGPAGMRVPAAPLGGQRLAYRGRRVGLCRAQRLSLAAVSGPAKEFF